MESRLSAVYRNLEVIGNVKEYEKLCIVIIDTTNVTKNPPESITPETHTLNIDQRYIQLLQRAYTGDGRAPTMSFIVQVLDEVKSIADIAYKSYGNRQGILSTMGESMFVQTPQEVLDMLKTKLTTAIKGLERLKATTYASDRQYCLDIDGKLIGRCNLLISGIQTFFTRDKSVAYKFVGGSL